ncbi:hypothetical protein KKB55_19360 [Myxococcota bacterium]|nr:hypothetical protein [Myxococcota bacterium]MBU1899907.1 hypothetical protein [Myxococcota bacterium]
MIRANHPSQNIGAGLKEAQRGCGAEYGVDSVKAKKVLMRQIQDDLKRIEVVLPIEPESVLFVIRNILEIIEQYLCIATGSKPGGKNKREYFINEYWKKLSNDDNFSQIDEMKNYVNILVEHSNLGSHAHAGSGSFTHDDIKMPLNMLNSFLKLFYEVVLDESFVNQSSIFSKPISNNLRPEVSHDSSKHRKVFISFLALSVSTVFWFFY